jgi:GNAT superfamily N-acetyltransferase
MKSISYRKDYKDYDHIARFKKSFMTDSDRTDCSARSFVWKIDDNPHRNGSVFTAGCDDTLVGLAVVTPKMVMIKGQRVLAGEIGDTFTDKQYRRLGIFGRLVNMVKEECQERGIGFIYGTPNDNSLPGYQKRLNFPLIESLKVDYIVCPIRSASILADKFPSLRGLAGAVGFACDFFFKFLHVLKRGKRTGYVTRMIDYIPEELGSLFQRVLPDYDFIMERKPEYLRWRFINGPDKHYIFIAEDENGKIAGYCMVAFGTWKNIPVGYLMDYLIDGRNKEVFRGLVLEAIRYCRKNSVEMIAAWNVRKSWHTSLFRCLGFLHFRDVPVICHNSDWGKTVLKENLRFYFTMADAI